MTFFNEMMWLRLLCLFLQFSTGTGDGFLVKDLFSDTKYDKRQRPVKGNGTLEVTMQIDLTEIVKMISILLLNSNFSYWS